MRICDKCKKKLRKGDGNLHMDFGYSFTYDVCAECEKDFLLHVDSFFNQSNEAKGGWQMSELKVASIFEFEKVLQGQSNKLFYSKSEADAIFAKKDKKICRIERALWLARANRADESHFMWCQLIYDKKYGIVKFNVKKEWGENIKQGQMLHTPQGWADVWKNVERKCLAKAEEYK